MNFSFFREQETFDEADILSDALMEDTSQIVTTWQDVVATELPPTPLDPVRKAAYIQIGLVSIEANSQLPSVLSDVSQSQMIQQVHLPRNPRIADNELYVLDGMDYIMVLSSTDRRLSSDMVRWLKRLKQLQVPMLVLLPYEVENRREQQRVNMFSKRVGIPFIALNGQDIEAAREQFVEVTMQQMPALSLAMAAHLPAFRESLIVQLMLTAISDSLTINSDEDIQMQMVRQMCAAHGFDERKFDEHRVSMETLIKTTYHVTKKLVKLFPIRNRVRRSCFTNAVCTLLVGHATASYLGSSVPSGNSALIPQIWRLYRASRQSIST